MGGIFNTASRTFTTVDIPMHLLKYGGRRKFNAAVALGDYVIFSPEMAQEIGIFRVLDRSFSVVDITTSLKFDKFPGTYDTFGGAVAMGNTVIFSPSYTSAVGISQGTVPRIQRSRLQLRWSIPLETCRKTIAQVHFAAPTLHNQLADFRLHKSSH